MDGFRFDTLARSLTRAGSRRAALTVVLGGALATRGLGTTEAKKKKACPPCKKRKQGKCKGKKPDGTTCAGGVCQGGRCVAAAPPPPPCVGAAGATPCGSAGQCIAGRCAEPCGAPCNATCQTCPSTHDAVHDFCGRRIGGCDDLTTPCLGHADCGPSELCTRTQCAPINGMTNRCHHLCGT